MLLTLYLYTVTLCTVQSSVVMIQQGDCTAGSGPGPDVSPQGNESTDASKVSDKTSHDGGER